MARPSDFTQAMADKILSRIREGEFLTKICQEPDMPSRTAVYNWMEANATFKGAYAGAREAWADFYEEKVVSIAFDDKGDFFIENGKAVADHARVQRARLQVDTLKWLMSKWAPRRYGDKLAVDAGGAPATMEIKWIEHRIINPREEGVHAKRHDPPLLTYQPEPLPADLEPEQWATVLRVLELIPDGADADAAFEVMEKALRAHLVTDAKSVLP